MKGDYLYYIAIFSLLIFCIAAPTLSGCVSDHSTTYWYWLKEGVYARYALFMVQKGSERPAGGQVTYPPVMRNVSVGKGVVVVNVVRSAGCRSLTYEWRVLEVNESWAKVMLNLTAVDVDLDEVLAMPTPSGAFKGEHRDLGHYDVLSVVRVVYVRLSDRSVYYNGSRIGEWVYWLHREEIERGKPIVFASNYTVPSLIPSNRMWYVGKVTGPLSEQGVNYTVDLGFVRLGAERLARTGGGLNVTEALRALGIEVPENASIEEIMRIVEKRLGAMSLPLPPQYTAYYDMVTGIMVYVKMGFGYYDDILYRALGVGYLGVLNMTYLGAGRLKLVDTNVSFSVPIIGGWSPLRLGELMAPIALLASLTLLLPAAYVWARRRCTG